MTAGIVIPEFMAERPKPGPARPYNFPDFSEERLANGARLVVAPVHSLPIVSVLVLLEAGSSADPRGQEGVARLTAALLSEGTATMDGAELTDSFERIGAALDAYADWDATIAKVTMLAPRLPEALQLLSEVILTPSFAEREVERLRAERLSEILQQRMEPRGLADEMFDRLIYDPASRYALPSGGNERSVGALTREAIVAFHASRYGASSATIVVVGDVTRDSARSLVEKAFGSWTGGTANPPHVDAAPARRERMTHLVARTDAQQAELRLGHVGIPRLHDDYFPVTVMNAILGGLFNSRLNLNLREKHGYTYGAHSSFDWRRFAGPFVVGAAVQSDVAAAAVREALGELERFAEREVSAAELRLALDYLEGVFPLRFETTGAIAGALAGKVMYGLPDDYYDTYRSRVRAVTAADVQRVAQEQLRMDELQLVVVGDPAVVAGPIGELGLGAMRSYDTEGRRTDG